MPDRVSRCDLAFGRPGSPIEVHVAGLWASRRDDDAAETARLARNHQRADSVQARFLTADPASLSSDEALDALIAVQQHRARLDAIEVELLARAAGATRVVRDVLVEDRGPDGEPRHDGAPRTITFTDVVVDEIACALHRPVAVVQSQLQTARMLHGPLTRTSALLRAGRITLAHATAIADHAARLLAAPLGIDPDADLVLAAACADLQDRVLPHAPTETVTECRARSRRVIASIDPAGAAARRRRARAHCDVTGRPLDDGLALIEAVVPALDAAAILDRIDAAARDAITTGDVEQYGLGCDPTLGQVRAAVLARLVREGCLADAEGGSRAQVEIGVLVDAATLAGLTPDGPAWIDVNGQPAETGRDALLDLLQRADVDASFRRLVCDPASGALVDRGQHLYAATPALRAWLEARDQRCTHPGCTRRARHCDVDHATDFSDGGPTTRANTHLRCRRHHNAKTHLGWTVENPSADGSHDLISPAGRRYHHEPVRLLPEPPGPAACGVDPPRPAQQAAGLQDDDEPPF